MAAIATTNLRCSSKHLGTPAGSGSPTSSFATAPLPQAGRRLGTRRRWGHGGARSPAAAQCQSPRRPARLSPGTRPAAAGGPGPVARPLRAPPRPASWYPKKEDNVYGHLHKGLPLRLPAFSIKEILSASILPTWPVIIIEFPAQNTFKWSLTPINMHSACQHSWKFCKCILSGSERTF
ncbi:uncharacterized protein LOC144255013 [Urocitellus parryii]